MKIQYKSKSRLNAKYIFFIEMNVNASQICLTNHSTYVIKINKVKIILYYLYYIILLIEKI